MPIFLDPNHVAAVIATTQRRLDALYAHAETFEFDHPKGWVHYVENSLENILEDEEDWYEDYNGKEGRTLRAILFARQKIAKLQDVVNQGFLFPVDRWFGEREGLIDRADVERRSAHYVARMDELTALAKAASARRFDAEEAERRRLRDIRQTVHSAMKCFVLVSDGSWTYKRSSTGQSYTEAKWVEVLAGDAGLLVSVLGEIAAAQESHRLAAFGLNKKPRKARKSRAKSQNV